MLSIGIVGLPNVGKSTLFQALTKKSVAISNYPFCTIDPNVGVVSVPDERLEKLAATFRSKKVVPTVVEFHDIAGLVKNAAKGEGLGNEFLSHIRSVDAVCEVVRCFPESDIVHVEGSVDPKRDLETIHLELILADLQIVEKALTKAASEAKSGSAEATRRRDALVTLKQTLESEELLANHPWEAQEQTLMRELGLLTIKPLLVTFNVAEEEVRTTAFEKTQQEKTAFLKENFPQLRRVRGLALAIRLEAELAELTAEEAALYRRELEISSDYRGLDALISNSYETLELITFFTTGEDETRAWTVRQGSTAPVAGGRIHSDFEEKFIRAEVIPWQTLIEIGSWHKARESGMLRTVGRDYIVQDGDVIEIKI